MAMVQRLPSDSFRSMIHTQRECEPSALDMVHNAYHKLSHQELVLFLKVRSLPTIGTDSELASRLAHFDVHTYNIPGVSGSGRINGTLGGSTLKSPNGFYTHGVPPSPPDSANPLSTFPPRRQPRSRPQMLAPDLPVELLAEIMDRIGDWELSKAVGVPTSLSRPVSWTRATHTDEAILTGYLPLIRSADPASNPPTKVGSMLAVRFGYVHVLAYFSVHHKDIFSDVFCPDSLIPIAASCHGRTALLSWWKHNWDTSADSPQLSTKVVSESIDGASRNGQLAALDWWLQHSSFSPEHVARPLPFEYTEYSLEFASAKNHIPILQWWKTHHLSPPHLTLKPGRSLDFASTAGNISVLTWWATSSLDFKYDKSALYLASCHGKVDVLRWWLQNGMRLQYDGEVLVGATKHNRPEVLEWWNKSGLEVQYRMCDVEEALEDAIGGGEEAREWWKRKGVDFNTTDKEWTQLRNLN